MKNLLFVFIAILLLGACGDTEQASTESEIYLIRHFQKQAVTPQSGNDVALTEKGHLNAKRLAEHLENKGIISIYSTNYNRTKQTAMPTSELMNIPISEYDPKDLAAFASLLLASENNHLVVGHSNTTGVLFGMLGCESIVLGEKDYGDIMVLRRVHTGTSSNIQSCTSYQLDDNKPLITDLLLVGQSDLSQYYIQTNAAFTINDVLETESLLSGVVEIGFIIDENGDTSNFEIVKSSPEDGWHAQAINAAQQLTFSPSGNPIPMGKNVYSTWVFKFTAN